MPSKTFQELDHQSTPIGDITLRRRRYPATGDRDIYEVKLGEEFLMSSLFVAAEEALADLGIAAAVGEELNVVVGGLGLGHTAHAALQSSRVAQLRVIEYLPPVIRWHEQGLVPLGEALTSDSRCQLILGDFFARAVDAGTGFDAANPGLRYDAILLDIDHTPDLLLNAQNGEFYNQAGLSAMTRQLQPEGVFGLWSDTAVPEFEALLATLFQSVEAHEVRFDNPFQPGRSSSNWVYVARGVL